MPSSSSGTPLLISLRHRYSELADPRLDPTQVIVDAERATFVVDRGPTQVLVNLGPHGAEFVIAEHAVMLAASRPDIRRDGRTVGVPPDAVAIVRAVASRLPRG